VSLPPFLSFSFLPINTYFIFLSCCPRKTKRSNLYQLEKMLAMDSKVVATQGEAAAQIVAAADILEIQATEAIRSFDYLPVAESQMGDPVYAAMETSAAAATRNKQLALWEQRNTFTAGGSVSPLERQQFPQETQEERKKHENMKQQLLSRGFRDDGCGADENSDGMLDQRPKHKNMEMSVADLNRYRKELVESAANVAALLQQKRKTVEARYKRRMAMLLTTPIVGSDDNDGSAAGGLSQKELRRWQRQADEELALALANLDAEEATAMTAHQGELKDFERTMRDFFTLEDNDGRDGNFCGMSPPLPPGQLTRHSTEHQTDKPNVDEAQGEQGEAYEAGRGIYHGTMFAVDTPGSANSNSSTFWSRRDGEQHGTKSIRRSGVISPVHSMKYENGILNDEEGEDEIFKFPVEGEEESSNYVRYERDISSIAHSPSPGIKQTDREVAEGSRGGAQLRTAIEAGARVHVWWEEEGEWYAATVIRRSSSSDFCFDVLYDDGEEEDAVDLSLMRLEQQLHVVTLQPSPGSRHREQQRTDNGGQMMQQEERRGPPLAHPSHGGSSVSGVLVSSLKSDTSMQLQQELNGNAGDLQDGDLEKVAASTGRLRRRNVAATQLLELEQREIKIRLSLEKLSLEERNVVELLQLALERGMETEVRGARRRLEAHTARRCALEGERDGVAGQRSRIRGLIFNEDKKESVDDGGIRERLRSPVLQIGRQCVHEDSSLSSGKERDSHRDSVIILPPNSTGRPPTPSHHAKSSLGLQQQQEEEEEEQEQEQDQEQDQEQERRQRRQRQYAYHRDGSSNKSTQQTHGAELASPSVASQYTEDGYGSATFEVEEEGKGKGNNGEEGVSNKYEEELSVEAEVVGGEESDVADDNDKSRIADEVNEVDDGSVSLNQETTGSLVIEEILDDNGSTRSSRTPSLRPWNGPLGSKRTDGPLSVNSSDVERESQQSNDYDQDYESATFDGGSERGEFIEDNRSLDSSSRRLNLQQQQPGTSSGDCGAANTTAMAEAMPPGHYNLARRQQTRYIGVFGEQSLGLSEGLRDGLQVDDLSAAITPRRRHRFPAMTEKSYSFDIDSGKQREEKGSLEGSPRAPGFHRERSVLGNARVGVQQQQHQRNLDAQPRRVVTLTFGGDLGRFPIVGFLGALAEVTQVAISFYQDLFFCM
jgi:hypothetical protein